MRQATKYLKRLLWVCDTPKYRKCLPLVVKMEFLHFLPHNIERQCHRRHLLIWKRCQMVATCGRNICRMWRLHQYADLFCNGWKSQLSVQISNHWHNRISGNHSSRISGNISVRCIPNSNKHSGSVLPAEEPAVPGGGGPGPGVGQGTTNSYLFFSVVDPNTLNLDPDLGFRANLDPDPRLC